MGDDSLRTTEDESTSPTDASGLAKKRQIHSGRIREEFGPNELSWSDGLREGRERGQAAGVPGVPSGGVAEGHWWRSKAKTNSSKGRVGQRVGLKGV